MRVTRVAMRLMRMNGGVEDECAFVPSRPQRAHGRSGMDVWGWGIYCSESESKWTYVRVELLLLGRGTLGSSGGLRRGGSGSLCLLRLLLAGLLATLELTASGNRWVRKSMKREREENNVRLGDHLPCDGVLVRAGAF